MARMSIDDMISRDTRIDRLARLCGWSRRETRACLEDIWSLCYDRVVPYLPGDDIEVTAARDAISPPAYPEGFVAALRAVGLARDAVAADRFYVRKDGAKIPWPDQNWRDRVYLAGAAERVGYLLAKKSAGHEGGVKSGKSRRSKSKQSFAPASSESQARGNPPDPVPDPSSVPDVSPDPAPRAGAPTHTSQPRDPRIRERHPNVGLVARRTWDHACRVHGELVAERIPVPPWPANPRPDFTGWVALLDRVTQLLVEYAPDEAESIARNRIDVAAAKARKEPADAGWFSPTAMFTPGSFDSFAYLTPEQVGRKAAQPSLRSVPNPERPKFTNLTPTTK